MSRTKIPIQPKLFIQALNESRGLVAPVARRLGVSRMTVMRRLKTDVALGKLAERLRKAR